MPYTSDATVPRYVAGGKRAQWRKVWNSVHAAAIKDGHSRKNAEARAFRIANGVVKAGGISVAYPQPDALEGMEVTLAETKMEGDVAHPSTHYLVVEDPKRSTTWHLRVKGPKGKPDHGLMGAAWAALHGGYRGNKYEGPHKQAAIDKLTRMYHGEGMQTPAEKEQMVEEVLSDEQRQLLSARVRGGLLRIPIAYTGKFSRLMGDGERRDFSITGQDLRQMRDNLKREGEVVIDYEHLSGGVAPPGWAKAAGWIRRLDDPAPFPSKDDPDRQIMFGWVHVNPSWLALLKTQEYRYFSPEIHWETEDEKGAQSGTRLAAGAATNRPFLRALPPILVGDDDYQSLMGMTARVDGRLAALTLSEPSRGLLVDMPGIHMDKTLKEENSMKKYKLRKLSDAELAEVKKSDDDDNGEMMGLADSETGELLGVVIIPKEPSGDKVADKKLETEVDEDKTPADKAEETMDEQAVKQDDEDEDEEEDEEEDGADADEKDGEQMTKKKTAKVLSGTELFSQILGGEDGKLKLQRLAELVDTGRIKPGMLIRAQEADRIVHEGIMDGKLLRRQRLYHMKQALSDMDGFRAHLKGLPVIVDKKVLGLSSKKGGAANTSEQELQESVKGYMKENPATTYGEALSAVTRDNPRLWDRHERFVQQGKATSDEEDEGDFARRRSAMKLATED